MNNKIAIIGSSGLIGSALIENFSNFHITTISGKKLYENPESVKNDLFGVDIIINLAGHPVFGRWTKKKKEKIYASRVGLSLKLFEILCALEKKPAHLINASAIGIYSDGYKNDETSENYSDDELATLVKKWESAASKIKELNIALTIIRLGMVLSRKGGAYKLQRRIIRLGLGGKLGSGKQVVSFILINDLVNAIKFIIENQIYGIVNLVCPEPVNNETFIKEIALKFKVPALLSIPGIFLKILFGYGSQILLNGQNVYPGVLLQHKFSFLGNNLKKCIEILEK
jgi:uncharacterized protein